MLPIKLKMQAFASYAGAAEIDFQKPGKLFLIHGETGAGKTAVLDAMMYALYGESSGGERTEMRCALPAAKDIPTEVEFTFAVRGKPYTFIRSITVTPRSKKLEFHQDCFYRDEDGTRRSFFENPKQALVRAKAEELTGLSAEQFRQVVILPQGKFERLLTSDSREKETILSTLFGAEKYTRLSDRLSEKAEACRRNIALESTALKTMLAAESADSPERLAEETDRLRAETETLAPRLAKAKNELSGLRKKLTAAEVLRGKFVELENAEKRLAELCQRTEEICAAREALKKHENASKAKPEKAALSAAENLLDARNKQYAAAQAQISVSEKACSEAEEKKKAVAAKEEENISKARELAVLESLAPVYGKISSREVALKKIASELSESERYHAVTAGKLENTSAEISRLSEAREKITSEYSRELPMLAARKAALEQGAEAEKRLNKYAGALKKIHEKVSSIEADAERLEKERAAADSEYGRLYGEYLSNTAAELSSKLKEGMPCPVCGSLSHPCPAASVNNAVTSENVRAARDKFEILTEKLSARLTEAAAEKARIPAAEEYISTEEKIISDTGYTAEELKSVVIKHEEALRQMSMLTDIEKNIGELSSLKRRLEEQVRNENGKISAIKDSEARAEAELASLRKQLDTRYGDENSYSRRVLSLKDETAAFAREKAASEKIFSDAEKSRIEAAAAFSQAEKLLAEAENARSDALNAFCEKLSELDIPQEEYEKYLLDARRAEELSAGVRQYELDIHAAKERAETLKAELDNTVPPQLEEIRLAVAEAEASLTELSGKAALASERLKRLEKLMKEYSVRFAALEKETAKSDKLTAFARFMHGDKGISFTRYVLSIMLSLVTAEANRILANIHGGRFRLLVKTELAANSKQGLDLEVENLAAETPVRYGVKNLSGGEKFLISLALSLGLSAVARSRNGGIEIEAMFIDEGFGSLDSASLREAVSILCGLSLGRNTVGIISHIEELKNVIPCGIEIVKDPDGSSRILSSG